MNFLTKESRRQNVPAGASSAGVDCALPRASSSKDWALRLLRGSESRSALESVRILYNPKVGVSVPRRRFRTASGHSS